MKTMFLRRSKSINALTKRSRTWCHLGSNNIWARNMILKLNLPCIVMSPLQIWNSNSLYLKMMLISILLTEILTVRVKTIITSHKIQLLMVKLPESSVTSIQISQFLMKTHCSTLHTKSIQELLMGQAELTFTT